mmetsp:Transcript_1954/g.3560  ORF Transcript_1954/g.3560 Transcript_1954/m.3560 type:complete len:443 (-) Transcript_1954:55-1383(-)
MARRSNLCNFTTLFPAAVLLLLINVLYLVHTSTDLGLLQVFDTSFLFDHDEYYSHVAMNQSEEEEATTTNHSRKVVKLNNEKIIYDPNASLEKKEEITLSNHSSSYNFTRYDDVVIVTKTLWARDIDTTKQMLCYISHAYNDKRRYDIVVFTTIPYTEEEIASLQEVVAPTKLTVVPDGPSLEEHLAAMTKEERDFLYSRCKMDGNETITWQHYCTEPNSRHYNNLGYCWQAEFRAYNIWTHPAISKYKYMLWLDADTRVAAEWTDENDPMKVMIENDLHLLFAGFPYGRIDDIIVREKMERVYNKSICSIRQGPDGTLKPTMCTNQSTFDMKQVAGNHHITNLETYRKPIHQEFLRLFVGDYRFSRKYDDQIAVTIPAVMEDDGKKAWHERSVGLSLKIAHHRMFDNNGREKAPANKWHFFQTVKHNFTGLEERCGKYATS